MLGKIEESNLSTADAEHREVMVPGGWGCRKSKYLKSLRGRSEHLDRPRPWTRGVFRATVTRIWQDSPRLGKKRECKCSVSPQLRLLLPV